MSDTPASSFSSSLCFLMETGSLFSNSTRRRVASSDDSAANAKLAWPLGPGFSVEFRCRLTNPSAPTRFANLTRSLRLSSMSFVRVSLTWTLCALGGVRRFEPKAECSAFQSGPVASSRCPLFSSPPCPGSKTTSRVAPTQCGKGGPMKPGEQGNMTNIADIDLKLRSSHCRAQMFEELASHQWSRQSDLNR